MQQLIHNCNGVWIESRTDELTIDSKEWNAEHTIWHNKVIVTDNKASSHAGVSNGDKNKMHENEETWESRKVQIKN